MRDLLFLLADLWMIFAGYYCGTRFIRSYGNYLLGLEWIIVATSGVNFLVWSLLFGGDPSSPLGDVGYFFDAFSRSVGITLILVLGLMQVTHHYKPSRAVDVGVFALAGAAGLYLQQFREFHVGPATFYVVVNLLTTLFLAYFSWRLWRVGAKGMAVWAGLASAAACAIAVVYDFFHIPGDDTHHTLFYIAALTAWGTQMYVYFFAYRALDEREGADGAVRRPATTGAGGRI